MSDYDAEKQLAASHAVRKVQSGMHVGLGSGSTAAHAVRFLAERIRDEGLRIVAVPTSLATQQLAESLGIPLAENFDQFQLDICIDGADLVTRAGYLIKGAGAALFHERIVASAATEFIVIIDSRKLVADFDGCTIPVELSQFGWRNSIDLLESLGCHAVRRQHAGRDVVTEEGHAIVDCRFDVVEISKLHELSDRIYAIAGVIDHGLFLGMATEIVVGRGNDVEVIRVPK